MAENVAVIKPEKYVTLAVAELYRESVLPNVVTRMSGEVFRGSEGDSVTYTGTALTQARDYTWRTRVDPIVLDRITRPKTSISIGTHIYSAVALTDEQLTMDITDFTGEVLQPQLVAVRERLESKVVAALAAEPFKTTNLNAVAADDPYKFALKARNVLNKQGTPQGNRVLLVGANVETWILQSDSLVKYDPAQATTAYQEAGLGRIAGFNVVTSALIPENAIYALHNSALVLANLAPAVPQGVTYGATRSFQGYGMRVIRDYDSNFLQDRSVVSTFSGIAGVRDELALDVNKALILDADGFATYNNVNVRGAKGVFTPAA